MDFRGPTMEVRYYVNPVTGLPHIYDHGVTEAEVERVLNRPGEDGPSSDGSRQALGQSEGGRYLRVVYVPDEDGEGVFVVTAYTPGGAGTQGVPQAEEEKRAMNEQRFPAGWDQQRVQRLLAELDARTEEEWVAADEAAAAEGDDQAVITVPTVLLPEIRRLLATHKTA